MYTDSIRHLNKENKNISEKLAHEMRNDVRISSYLIVVTVEVIRMIFFYFRTSFAFHFRTSGTLSCGSEAVTLLSANTRRQPGR